MSSTPSWLWVLACSSAIVLVAYRTKSLSLSGAIVAFVIGTVALRAGWGWGGFLISWFVLGSALSRFARNTKELRTRSIVEKGARRDAYQVLANGGVFAIAALLELADHAHPILVGLTGVSALASAAADTWGTEIGILSKSQPWSLRLRMRVPAGTSGAVSIVGSMAMVAGALTTAMLGVAFELIPHEQSAFVVVSVAGVVGALFDTLIGAYVQERRYCETCSVFTERRVHDCGTSTHVREGIHRLNNDVVNALCTLVGGATAIALALTPFFRT